MDDLIGVILTLLIFISFILGWVAFSRTTRLRAEIDALSQQLAELLRGTTASQTGSPSVVPTSSTPPLQEIEDAVEVPGEDSVPTAEPAVNPPKNYPSNTIIDSALTHLQEHWMVWLGGVSIGLAGIFMVVYSIEQGLLDPQARILLSTLGGLALWVGAETLRRRHVQPASLTAAMAAGGSITLFAAILAATHLYDLVGIRAAFALLSLTALLTMGLAVLHGPLLAALGILGAYAVPLLVSTGTGNVEAALAYSAVITASALTLLNFVSARWIWWGALFGAVVWWALSFGANSQVFVRGWYLLTIAYLFSALPGFDLLLQRKSAIAPSVDSLSTYIKSAFSNGSTHPQTSRLLPVLLILGTAAALSIHIESQYQLRILMWTPWLALVLFLARQQEALVIAAWWAFAATLAACLSQHLSVVDNRWQLQLVQQAFETQYLGYLTVTCGLVWAASLWNFSLGRSQHPWAALTALTPVLTLLTGYLTTSPRPDTWALLAFTLGFIYIAVASSLIHNPKRIPLVIWLFFAGHLAIASAVAIRFSPQTLTFALALQLVSLAWIVRRFQVDVTWLIKALTALLTLRLTLNPWLLDYPIDQHWSLWSYGGTTLCCTAAMRMLHPADNPRVDTGNIKAWLEAAALHLTALTLWVELRYALYDGDIFRSDFTATEAGLNVVLFGLIAIAYHMRSKVSLDLATLYRWFSNLTLTLAGLSYLAIFLATAAGLDWAHEHIGTTPITNEGLLLYGAPCLIFFSVYQFGPHHFQKWAWRLSGLAVFVFVNLQIRHWWTNSFDIFYLPVSNPELLAYSAVWLVIAVGVLLAGLQWSNQSWHRQGIILLGLVVAKIFLIDMDDLSGLLRVASFLGLGLALLGLSFLHQKLAPTSEASETQ